MPDMQQVLRDVQDTLAVVAAIQQRQAALLKDHAEWLAAHDQAILDHEREMREMREHGRQIDERLDRLVSAMGEWMRQQRR